MRSPEKVAFWNARGRCQLKTATGYEHYGGRGIEFRLESVEQLVAAIGRRPTPAHSLDRIDNDGHYEVGNIRWATRTEQNSNRRPNSDEARKRQSEAAKERCTPEWRAAVSARVKEQHRQGNFGRTTWPRKGRA